MEPVGPIGESQGFVRLASSEYFATADLSHFVYESTIPLWAFDASESEAGGLYEYANLGNPHPLLVGVRGGPQSTDLISACGTKLGSPHSTQSGAVGEALSADGRVVIFTAQKCSNGVPVLAQQLWARIDGESPDARSVELSAPAANCPACATSEPEGAVLQGASEDGFRALFTSAQQLTSEAQQGSQNLYLYEDLKEQPLSGNHLVDISASDTSGHGPDVQGVMAVSADGSHVYFVAGGVLAGANAEGASPAEGGDNLYVYERDATFPAGHTNFIATLPGQGATANGEEAEAVEWTGRSTVVASVTPDGRFLLFTSHGALTSDTVPRTEAPAQVFRYDADSQRLLRVSIGRAGFNNNGNAGGGEAQIALPANNRISSGRRDPSMSDDGSRAFFESPVALTPGALDDVSVNGRDESAALARNVYEWQAPGTGECGEASGCVALISDGKDTTETSGGDIRVTFSSVKLIGTDASGENVFFSTADPLVPADTDTGYDIYDARSGGGFASLPTPIPCQADACKGAATRAGFGPSPGSPTFNGPEEGARHPVKSKHHRHKRKHRTKKTQEKRRKHRRAGHDHGGKQ